MIITFNREWHSEAFCQVHHPLHLQHLFLRRWEEQYFICFGNSFHRLGHLQINHPRKQKVLHQTNGFGNSVTNFI
jgi:hypothetical protein